MERYEGLLCLLLTLAVCSANEAGTVGTDEIKKFVKAGTDVVLECDIASGQSPELTWMDDQENKFYEVSRSGQQKFEHTHSSYTKMDPRSFALTIKEFSSDKTGYYICIVKTGSTPKSRRYYLSYFEPISCDLRQNFNELDRFLFRCQLNFDGESIKAKWTKNDVEVETIDEGDVGVIGRNYNYTAFPEDNGKKVECSVPETGEKCHVFLDITYTTKKVYFEPTGKNSVAPGETIRCIGDGNPEPSISVQRKGDDKWVEKGTGSVTFPVPESWVGQSVELFCEGGNLPNPKLSINDTFPVVAAKTDSMASTSSGNTLTAVFSLNLFMAILLSSTHQ